jgi:N-hydroxyarylamine O-acetyltransferase
VGLDRDLVERVLERLGFASAPGPDRAGLAAVYAAWCRRVPFDNVRKRLHVAAKDPSRLPGDDPPEFLAAWLAWGTGGTCWAGNGALCELLRALGFDAERGVATMMALPDLPPNHGTVFVSLDGARWMVDASILFAEPLAPPHPHDEPRPYPHPPTPTTPPPPTPASKITPPSTSPLPMRWPHTFTTSSTRPVIR